MDDVYERWNGVLEIFTHYYYPETCPEDSPVLGKDITVVKKPEKHPEFVVLKDEKCVCTEELYYRCFDSPKTMFSFHEYTVTMHERLELHRFPFDR